LFCNKMNPSTFHRKTVVPTIDNTLNLYVIVSSDPIGDISDEVRRFVNSLKKSQKSQKLYYSFIRAISISLMIDGVLHTKVTDYNLLFLSPELAELMKSSDDFYYSKVLNLYKLHPIRDILPPNCQALYVKVPAEFSPSQAENGLAKAMKVLVDHGVLGAEDYSIMIMGAGSRENNLHRGAAFINFKPNVSSEAMIISRVYLDGLFWFLQPTRFVKSSTGGQVEVPNLKMMVSFKASSHFVAKANKVVSQQQQQPQPKRAFRRKAQKMTDEIDITPLIHGTNADADVLDESRALENVEFDPMTVIN